MNCLEFRRAALADPRRLPAGATVHAGDCPACRQFLARSLELETRLAAALRVPLPEGLAERLLERTGAARRPRWLALAASLLAAAAIALALGLPRSDAMALAGIEFVVFDEAQSIADAAPTDLRVLFGVARDMGVSLPHELGDIRYVCVYPFVAGAAHHLLLKSPLGKVTLLLIPGRSAAARAAGAAYGLKAAVLPARTGTIVIIGESARSVGRVETLLKSG
ncbi:MAG TPA: DUF3379 family protein [Burkholderiales bacterium]|nr:DUF3379 family protein [Burkholderiales bacterium]